MSKTKLTFSVNPNSPIAVYVQIENQIQFAIAAKKLKPGDFLPSVRSMSAQLDTNPNTVTKAYRDLELLQLVHSRRGVGVTVAEGAPALCREKARALAKAHLQEAAAEYIASGVSESEVRDVIAEALISQAPPYKAG